MDTAPTVLEWSAQLSLSYSPRGNRLPGDKIILPTAALEQLLSASASAEAVSAGPAPVYDPWNSREYASYRNNLEERQQRLPQPLTFRLVNPDNGHVVYAGIQEFSADDGEIILSSFLHSVLGLGHAPEEESQTAKGEVAGGNGAQCQKVTVHFEQLSKGSYVKLRPLEAGYDVEDWKALLEQHLRSNFTTLSKGETLEVPGEATNEHGPGLFRFLVDEFRPDGNAICVVDTDLEVDIEALNEDQARETVKRIASKYQNGIVSNGGSSTGGLLDLYKEHNGQLIPGEYVDYELPSWPRNQAIEIQLIPDSEDDIVDLLVSPFSPRQRVHPRADHYVFADWEERSTKRVKIQPSNVELEDAEALYISVYGFKSAEESEPTAAASNVPRRYNIKLIVSDTPTNSSGTPLPSDMEDKAPNDGDVQCKNCGQWVPGKTLMLHENFCLRNNVLCPQGCGQVFQKRSEAFQKHWHCPHDTFSGSSDLSRDKHNTLYHPPEPFKCSRCSTKQVFSSIPLLAQHHVTTCPAKLILCRFCHLAVPQEGDPDEPNPEALLSGLTVHELADGSRTTECHLCGKITRMRDMTTHMAHHNLERKSRPRPRVCRNSSCGNTLDGTNRGGSTRAGKETGNDIGLCSSCFGPLYVSLYDPDGKALKRRIERRYLQQLMTGCGKSWCQNAFCRTGRANTGKPEEGTSAKTAIPLAKPFVDAVITDPAFPLHFCVDEASGRRRDLALMLEAEMKQRPGSQQYEFSWCLAACEAENRDLEKARSWLENFAPRRNEELGM